MPIFFKIIIAEYYCGFNAVFFTIQYIPKRTVFFVILSGLNLQRDYLSVHFYDKVQFTLLLTVIVTLRFAKLTAGSDFFARYIFPGLFIIGAAEAKNFKFHLPDAFMPSSEDA